MTTTVAKIQTVLEDAGVEFLNHGPPGVRMKPSLVAGKKKRSKPSR
jgi:hypothetical protein